MAQNAPVERPLSPHLQVYRPLFTMMMSIAHRITGAGLYFGVAVLAWWLVAAASGPAYFDYVAAVFASIPGRLVLLGLTWAVIHHALGGLRHFVWDTGRGLGERERALLSWLTLAGALVLTPLVWMVAYMLRGA